MMQALAAFAKKIIRNCASRMGFLMIFIFLSFESTAKDYLYIRGDMWDIYYYTSNVNNTPTHCAMVSRFTDGTYVLFLMIHDYNFAVGLSNDSWDLDENDSYSVSVYIDGRSQGSYDAHPITDRTIRIDFGNDESIYQKFRKGNHFSILTQKTRLKFSLKNTYSMLPKLLSCYETKIRVAGGMSNPFSGRDLSSRDRNPFRKMEPSVQDSRFEGLVELILNISGIDDVEFRSKSEVERELGVSGFGVSSWSSNTHDGLAMAIDLRDMSIEEIYEQMAFDSSECPGTISTILNEQTVSGDSIVQDGYTICKYGNSYSFNGIVSMSFKNHVALVMMIVSKKGNEPSALSDAQKIRRNIEEVFSDTQ